MSAADAEGRQISGTVWFRLTPPDVGVRVGGTEAAREIGTGLVREAMRLLVATAEREGFTVEIEYRQVVY